MSSIWGGFAIIIIGVLYGIVLFEVMIPLFRRFKYGQSIRLEGPRSHQNKKGTPTMGGVAIIMITIVIFSTLVLFNYKENHLNFMKIFLIMVPFLAFGIIGFIDDYLIIYRKNNDGLSPSIKFFFQIIVSVICYYLLLSTKKSNFLNFFGSEIDLKFFYGIFIVITFAGITNATNLTDGIDGLLGGSSLIIITGITILAGLFHQYETVYFGISLIIALLAFLIFNLPKASIFMGDVGSLAIGAALFAMLLNLNMEILVFIFGIVYVMETLSVILQVWFFKKTKGNRLFKMTPIHHHLELMGLKDVQIDLLFWFITFIFTIFACALGVRVF